jgi:hypothetical protein
MKALVLSALLMVFCMFTGSKFSYANINKSSITTATQKLVNALHKPARNQSLALTFHKHSRLNDSREDFISIEDDDDIVLARKLAVPIKYILLPDYSSSVHVVYSFQKSRLPFCKHFSYTSSPKYIFQRVLRI